MIKILLKTRLVDELRQSCIWRIMQNKTRKKNSGAVSNLWIMHTTVTYTGKVNESQTMVFMHNKSWLQFTTVKHLEQMSMVKIKKLTLVRKTWVVQHKQMLFNYKYKQMWF